MTFGIEAHWWKRPTFEKDLFLFLLTVGFLTVWISRQVISDTMKREARRKEELWNIVAPKADYGEHVEVPERRPSRRGADRNLIAGW